MLKARKKLNALIFAVLSFCFTSNTYSSVFISEIHYDNSGSDQGEAIELSGPVNSAIDDWSLALYNGANGQVYTQEFLSGSLNAADDCDEGFSVHYISGIQNGSPDGIALINPEGEVIEFISYEGSLTAIDGPAEGLTSTDIGVSEGSSTAIGMSLQNEQGIWFGPETNTFGSCTGGTPSTEITYIHTIQGDGDAVTTISDVKVEAIVTADYQQTTQLSGFFIQEEDSDADNDPQTSEALFVYCASCPVDVNVGDKVSVTGITGEYFGMSQITASNDQSIQVLESQQTLPSPAVIDLPINVLSSDLSEATAEIDAFYEALEGMIVRFNDVLTLSEYFNLSRFGQVRLFEGQRPRQFTDSHYPSEAGLIAHNIDLATRAVILDDDSDDQNVALFNELPVFFPEGGFSVDNYIRGGDTIESLTGVLHRSWAGSPGTDAWRIRPIPEAYQYAFEPQNLRTEQPVDVSAPFKVASFNVLNYFTTLDEGLPVCGPDGGEDCRGANSLQELDRQTQKAVAAICALDADIIGLMELENPAIDALETPLQSLVAAINTSCPTYAAIDTGPIGDDAITVALIYRPETTKAIGETAILDALAFTDPNNLGESKNRPAIAKSFKHKASQAVFTVAVNHLKSKGSSCGEGDDDLVSGQGNCNLTRTMAAEYQAQWLTTYPTGIQTDNTLIIGDLNAYRYEAPILALADAGYIDMSDVFLGDDAYGYVFDGQLGYLDYVLAHQSLAPYITGVTHWQINADEVNLLDYNDTIEDMGEFPFEAKPSALPLFDGGPYRSSDHDPVVIGIDFKSKARCPKKGKKKCHKRRSCQDRKHKGKHYKGKH